MGSLKRISWLPILVLAIANAACSTPRAFDPGRKGVFDDLSYAGKGRTVAQPRSSARDPSSETDHSERIAALKPQLKAWKWPLQDVEITSHYGPRNGEFHEGLDLRAKVGTPVFSIDTGKVIYAGRRIRGYGKMVIVRHPSGLASVYAHNSKLLVIEGQKIKRGQKIAISGQTGRVRGPHLHFEIRDGVAALDPIKLLPTVQPKAKPAKAKTVAALK